MMEETQVVIAGAGPVDEPRLRDVYRASMLVLRPDLHVVWRGDGPPADAAALARRATGRAAA